MQAITQTVEFGVLLTVGLYVLSHAVLKRTKITFLNPLMLSILLGVTFLLLAKIDVDDYRIGGHWVSFLLSPATVCLVIPFYKKSHLFKENWKPILAGIIAGTLAGLIVTVVLFQAFNMPEHIKHAILVKNSTGPIALEIADLLGRPKDLVMLMVIGSGMFGFMCGNFLLKVLRVENKVARGIAFGNTSHIVGTAKALSNSEAEGAMGSISILITGLVYLVLIPLLMKFV